MDGGSGDGEPDVGGKEPDIGGFGEESAVEGAGDTERVGALGAW